MLKFHSDGDKVNSSSIPPFFFTSCQDVPVGRVSQERQCLSNLETLCDRSGTLATLVSTEGLVAWETLAPTACQDDQVGTETFRFKVCSNVPFVSIDYNRMKLLFFSFCTRTTHSIL